MLLPRIVLEWTGEYDEVFVNLIHGINTPFLKQKRRLSEPLKRNTLYLLDKDRTNPVEVLPLVKISSAPRDAANACYFYNRKQADGVRYVSYHFENRQTEPFLPRKWKSFFANYSASEREIHASAGRT